MLSDLQGETITGIFYEPELLKTNQNKFRIEKVIRKNKNSAFVKWKGYSPKFNSWIPIDLRIINTTFIQNIYTAYAGNLDGYVVHAAAQKPTLSTPNENEYMEMTTENDLHQIFVHDFIWECFHGPLKYGEEILHINGNHKDNRLPNLKLNSNESSIIIKVTGNCSVSSYVWFFNN